MEIKVSKLDESQIRLLIPQLVSCLYNTPGCESGGLCHIVTDDYNLTDSDLDFVIDLCDKSDRLERDLCKLICGYLSQIPEIDRLECLLMM